MADANIPNTARLAHTTFVFAHESETAARALTAELLERFPMMGASGPTSTTMTGEGDVASVSDAARLALESSALADDEKVTLALELLECLSFEECLTKFKEWDMACLNGELVEPA